MPRVDLKKMLPRILLLLLVGGALVFWVIMRWPCVFRTVTGVPCPGCGLSRAWLAALRLDFGAAFGYHPMFWSIPVLVLYALFDGQIFKSRWLNFGILALLLGSITVCYVIRLVSYLSGDMSI